ncbi:hypothetical protein G3I34_21615 [Streptomyces sp. SID8014]|uniref:hypothetical protein n=1 Tax=Streptomyces TaxID=1883 RepID=UPI0013BB417F|nr:MULTISPECIES: hypothetical protein [unclassified Streptomyces]MBL3808515.1 hypothetical protein [Streptomyces sp. BRB081]NEC14815.1 hypothetical protein [Streptomyces sp. SID8014]
MDIASGVTVTMKLNPEYVLEHGDPSRVREKARAVANKSRRPVNKAALSES